MASKTVKGLTVEIGGDTTKLGKALQSVEKQSRSLSKELTDINKLLRYDPSNVEALAQKKKILAEAVEACAKKLNTLRDAQKQVQEQFERGEVTEEQYRALQREIIATENKLDDYKRSLNGVDNALRDLNGEAEETARDVDDMGDEAKQAANKVDDLGDKSKQADNKMSGLQTAADKAGGGFTTLKGVISNLISEALEELIEKLIEVGKYMAQTGIDFGATMSKVEALLNLPTEEAGAAMEKLTKLAMDMGAKTKFSANESAEAMTYLAQAGWTAEDIMSGLDGVMALAATDGVELATAAEITAQALNALGKGAGDANTFADILAVTAAKTCTNVEDMGYAFQYVGPVAGALGFEMDDLAVAIGMMADAGITGEKAGTSLRSLFTNMAKPTDAMTAAMEKYGISLTDSKGNMLDLDKILVQMRSAFSGLTEEQKTNLAATLAGKTGMAGLLSIVNASDKDFNEMTKAIAGSKDAAEKMAAVMQDNLAGDIEKLGGAFETLSLKIEAAFDGALRQAVQAITQFLEGGMSMQELLVILTDVFAQMGQKFMEFLPTLQQMGTELLTYLVNGLITGVPRLIDSAANLIWNFCVGLANNMPQIVQKGSELITGFLQSLINAVPRLITGAATIISSLARGITQNASGFVSKALDLLEGFADKLAQSLPTLISSGMEFIKNLVKGLMQALPEFISRAPEIISKFANLINDNFPTILQKGVEIIWELIKGIVKAIPTLVKNIPKIIKAIVDVWEAFNWLSLGKKAIDLLGKGVKGMVGFIKNCGTSIKDGIVNIIKKLPDTLKTLGSNGIKYLGNAIKSGLGNAKTAATAIFNGIKNVFTNLPSKLLSIGKDLVRGLWNGISDMTGWIIGKIEGFGESVLDGIKDFFGIKSPSREFAKIGRYLDEGLAKGLEDYADDPIKAAQAMASSVLDGASVDGLALERDLQNRTIKHAMSVTTAADNSMLGKLDKILTAIEKGQIITLDGKALVGGTVNAYDTALGQRRMLAARGAV